MMKASLARLFVITLSTCLLSSALLADDFNPKGPDGEKILMAGATLGRADIVKSLIEVGVDLNAKDNEGDDNALSFAVAHGHDCSNVRNYERSYRCSQSAH
jgi:ankyrin repeat protein